MRYSEKNIQEIIAECVGKVEEKLLPQLQAAKPSIQSVRFEYGHPLELVNNLKERSKDPGPDRKAKEGGKYDMFPIFWLFTDVNEGYGNNASYPDLSLNMIIATSGERTMKAPQRMATNFAPILEPLYREFIKQLSRSRHLKTQSPRQIKHSKFDRLYWGKSGLYGNEGNVFNDAIDAIEIQNLQLTLYT